MQVTDAGLFAFALGKFPGDEDGEKYERGNQNQPEREPPILVIGQGNGTQAAQHEAARPAGVQAVQPAGLVRLKHRRDNGIDIRLHAAVAEPEDDAAPVEQLVAVLLCRHEGVAAHALNALVRREGQRAVNQITDEGKDHCHLVADAVNEEAEDDDAHAEGPDAGALEFAHVHLVETEVGHELAAAENHAADERVAGGDEGNKAAPEQDGIVTLVHVVGIGLYAPGSAPRVNRKLKKKRGVSVCPWLPVRLRPGTGTPRDAAKIAMTMAI